MQWAQASGGLVIEDDYDAELRYDRTPIGALQGLDPGRVTHVGTAAKTLAPGVRLGWITAPASLVDALAARKSAADSGSPAISQLAFADLLYSGDYERHIAAARRAYRRRRDLLVRELVAELPLLTVRGAARRDATATSARRRYRRHRGSRSRGGSGYQHFPAHTAAPRPQPAPWAAHRVRPAAQAQDPGRRLGAGELATGDGTAANLTTQDRGVLASVLERCLRRDAHRH
jgi:hypothetical protein